MRQVTGLTSTYSSDEFGICSALYELGGMVVMHDASGCNSTYTTHDEPRWYDMDSMIYISAISETEAILGDDDKLIDDLIETAQELHPKFIALVGAPIPYMIGTDLDAIAAIVSRRTGIRCFAFAANGMRDYTVGVSMALERIVREYAVREPEIHSAQIYRQSYRQPGWKLNRAEKVHGSRDSEEAIGIKEEKKTAVRDDGCVVNIIGATPLDFSLNGSVASIQRWITDRGMTNGVCLSMGCSLEEVRMAGQAQVNLVVSAGGLAAAKTLRERFGTPYVAGVPVGERFSGCFEDIIRDAVLSSDNRLAYTCTAFRRKKMSVPTVNRGDIPWKSETASAAESEHMPDTEKPLAIIGEAVRSASLAAAIEMEYGVKAHVLCPLDIGKELLRPGDIYTPEEDDLMRLLGSYTGVIADPLYQPLVRGGQRFYPLPHEAFSGRIYDSVNPNLIAVRLIQ
ncbi:MAG: nitrogenase component 1 [Clostridiales bacterium]|nr:nitrogenase component 1 [Clostridiales bacterium]